jgi:phage terminase large subunit-like protein
MASERELGRLLALAAGLEGEELVRFLAGLPAPVRRTVAELWFWQRHGGQFEPEGDWEVWLIMAGRGFGKTRAGAEWVWARVREAGTVAGNCPLKIALVGGTVDEAVQVMIEGESGLVACARAGEEARWVPSRRRVDFSNGATGFVYSGDRPDKLRGPEHHFAWCDELAKWTKGEAAWDNLRMTMRLGERPRIVVTTTPRGTALMRRIRAEKGTKETGGSTWENIHSAARFRETMAALYAGTRLGRQELDGALLGEAEGALWTRALIEASRGAAPGRERLARVVVGVDPPASAHGDACGIVACGMDGDGVAWVLGDHSVAGASPEGWAAKVAAAAELWQADRVVAEANNGGEMVEAVLRGAGEALPVTLVHASVSKKARAEPVSVRFENGRARLGGAFPELEDELAGLGAGGGYEGPTRSPDRADAMIWAMSALFEREGAAVPRVRRL